MSLGTRSISVGQNKKEKKKNTLASSNTNYRTERKFVPINMCYCLLQIDELKFFLGLHEGEGALPNFDFFSM